MSDLPLTPEDVADICALIDGSKYDRLELRTARFALRLQRDGAGEGWTQDWDWQDTALSQASAVETVPLIDSNAITALLPGIFYHAPQPGAPPFVKIGDTVEADTVVGIIETMKLMNPVYAGRPGRIADVLVADGVQIDKGTALIMIEPTA